MIFTGTLYCPGPGTPLSLPPYRLPVPNPQLGFYADPGLLGAYVPAPGTSFLEVMSLVILGLVPMPNLAEAFVVNLSVGSYCPGPGFFIPFPLARPPLIFPPILDLLSPGLYIPGPGFTFEAERGLRFEVPIFHPGLFTRV